MIKAEISYLLTPLKKRKTMFLSSLMVLNVLTILFLSHFYMESRRENEPRAPKLILCALCFFILLIPGMALFDFLRIITASLFLTFAVVGCVFLIPFEKSALSLKGTEGMIKGDIIPIDERDVVFARARLPGKDSSVYKAYYRAHPEKEARDAHRRKKGILGRPGSIDNGYRPNVSMLKAAFDMPEMLGPYANPQSFNKKSPIQNKAESLMPLTTHEMDPSDASKMVKVYARHMGADLVGICRVNPLWTYSHRGEVHDDNWDAWGKPVENLPPYAVVILTGMNWEHVSTAPHSPSVAESANNYGKGAYLTTLLARWFSHMGYQGIAEHSRNYNMLMVPHAIDAGLGELGRHGYLVAPVFGSRVRVFAALTDMPLKVDRPISLGVDEFCRHCKKCAESCPSKSIPMGDKVVVNGTERWKINEESCFDYWAKVGTDCAICMAVCPFSRPETFSHNLIRYTLKHSRFARAVLPYMDNILYGRRWKPRRNSSWLDYTN